MAANLPRRSGLTQLNHLVAALFAQGVPLRPDFLYARRRPKPIDWDAPAKAPRTSVALKLGFPEMHLKEALIDRLRSRGTSGRLNPEPESTVPAPPHEEAGLVIENVASVRRIGLRHDFQFFSVQ